MRFKMSSSSAVGFAVFVSSGLLVDAVKVNPPENAPV